MPSLNDSKFFNVHLLDALFATALLIQLISTLIPYTPIGTKEEAEKLEIILLKTFHSPFML